MELFSLYNYFRSSASFRVRISINLKGLKYDYKAVHLLNNGGEQHLGSYKALNPSGEVPCLVEDGRTLGQSVAIIEYLDEKYPDPPLFPRDAWDRAKVRQIVEVINSGTQPLSNLIVNQQLEKQLHATSGQIREWNLFFMERGISAVEKLLESTAGTYGFGGTVTAADVFIVPQYFSALRFEVETEKYPIFTRVAKKCLELEAFQKATPACQPDTPANFKSN